MPDFTPFFQRVKDAQPDCFYVFVPAGNHAAAVFKTYAEHVAPILEEYLERGLLGVDPFQSIDQRGVGGSTPVDCGAPVR